ncbi:hypothetical protein MMC17_000547 [Xylographa soralifera]|nr:hypothetical protein [Xylographa soralifera]
MDALSGAASVTAIVTTAFQSIKVIHDVVSGIRNGPDQIRRLAEFVEDLRGILNQLRDQNNDDAGLVKAIKNCAEDLEAFKIKLTKLKTPGDTKVHIAWTRVVMLLKKEEFIEMQTTLQRHCTGLSLSLITMQRALGIQQFNSVEAVVQDSFRTATLDLQPTLLKINSACETQNEKLDRFDEVQIVRHEDAKQRVQEQIGTLNTNIKHSGRKILDSIGEQLAAVTTMSTQQSKSIERLLSQLQQIMPTTACRHATGVRKRHDDTRPEASSTHESKSSLNEDEQMNVDAERNTHVEVLESICRLNRLASEKQRTSFSKEAQDVIEDIERLFDLGDLQVRPSAQVLGKRKRAPKESDLIDNHWLDGLIKSRNLLRACSSIALNQSVTTLQKQALQKYNVQRRYKSYSTSLGTVCQHIGLRRNRQQFYTTDEDEEQDTTVEIFIASMTFIPKDARFGYKISSSFLQILTAKESLSCIPTLSFCRMVANDSEVFSLVEKGDLAGLFRLLQDGQATLTDCDEEGRSLLNYACYGKQPSICKYLIEAGADVTSLEKARAEYLKGPL